MSDFLKSLTAAAERNQTYIDQGNGRELRLGDRVVSTDKNAPPAKKVVDTVEEKLEEKNLTLDTESRGAVEYHVRHPDQTSNEVLEVRGERKESTNKALGTKRAGEYAMECRTRIRHEKSGGSVEVQQSWGNSSGATRDQSSTRSHETSVGKNATAQVGVVTAGGGKTTTNGHSSTRGTGGSATASSGAQAATRGERAEGEVFLRCDVESTHQDKLGGIVVEEGSESFSFDVEMGKHSIVHQTR